MLNSFWPQEVWLHFRTTTVYRRLLDKFASQKPCTANMSVTTKLNSYKIFPIPRHQLFYSNSMVFPISSWQETRIVSFLFLPGDPPMESQVAWCMANFRIFTTISHWSWHQRMMMMMLGWLLSMQMGKASCGYRFISNLARINYSSDLKEQWFHHWLGNNICKNRRIVFIFSDSRQNCKI